MAFYYIPLAHIEWYDHCFEVSQDISIVYHYYIIVLYSTITITDSYRYIHQNLRAFTSQGIKPRNSTKVRLVLCSCVCGCHGDVCFFIVHVKKHIMRKIAFYVETHHQGTSRWYVVEILLIMKICWYIGWNLKCK